MSDASDDEMPVSDFKRELQLSEFVKKFELDEALFLDARARRLKAFKPAPFLSRSHGAGALDETDVQAEFFLASLSGELIHTGTESLSGLYASCSYVVYEPAQNKYCMISPDDESGVMSTQMERTKAPITPWVLPHYDGCFDRMLDNMGVRR